ncbi:MAG: family 10 glycosylhydrolase [Verrucomicrobiae bacterium]|nr:family 10 glycosylhydrolase [Verrucomicrobiae bacterium]
MAFAFAAVVTIQQAIGDEPRWRNLDAAEMPSVPEPAREFRGVWVATVYNLDWPSKPGLPVDQQKAELLDILDRAAALNLNAVVLQVRTMCDALYDSPLEPWSYYLTGKVGKAPEPFWDPLEFAVDAAHRRGLELHAWLNPFRAATAEYGDFLPVNHIARQYPWVTRESGHHLWLDPSSDFVRDRFQTVVFDVVNRYDVDAVHMDDYFYPYPAKGDEPGLNDDDNFRRYRFGDALAHGKVPLGRNQWRRELVNGLVKNLYTEIKRTKPWVKLGISPFGIWRPGYPSTVKGMDAYDEIFADSRKWLREGWVDYFSPQLYWKLEGPQSFSTLYRWWQDQNLHGRHIWPGVAASRLGSGGEGNRWDIMEVVGQIEATRAYHGSSPGSGQLFWHWEAFATNRENISKLITQKRYVDRALPPASPWLLTDDMDVAIPMAASIRVNPEKSIAAAEPDTEDPASYWRIRWDAEFGNDEGARWWAIQVGTRISDQAGSEDKSGHGEKDREARTEKEGWRWLTKWVVPGNQLWARAENLEKVDAIAIRAVDRVGRLGKARVIERVGDQ